MQLPLLTAGDLVVAVLAACLAAVELWMFYVRRTELSHLWAGIVALATSVYAILAGAQYQATSPHGVGLIVRLQFLCFVVIAASLLLFAGSVTHRRLPLSKSVLVAVSCAWTALLFLTPWIVGYGTHLKPVGWLAHPFQQPDAGPLQIWLFLYCLLAGVAAAFFMSRSPADARRAKLFRIGLLAWLTTAAIDVAVGLSVTPAFLLEYGFLAFAGSLVALHLIDLRQAQAEVYRSRDRIWDDHMAVVSGAGEGILALDADRCVTVWNPALERITGLTFAGVAGQRLDELIPAYSMDLVAAARDVTMGSIDARPRVVEITQQRDTAPRTLLATLTPRRLPDKERPGVLAVIRDVTVERQAKASLEQSEATLRQLIALLPDLILVLAGGRILFANQAVADLLEYPTPEALVGLEAAAIIHPEDAAMAEQRLAESASSGAPARPQRVITRTGTAVEIEVTTLATTFQGRSAVLALGRDTREERRRQARDAEDDRLRAVGTLAAGVAHEINNPLTYVLGNLELSRLIVDSESPMPADELDELREMLAEAQTGAVRVQAIVKDLNTMSRSVPGRRPLDIEVLLRTALAMTRHVLRHRAQVVLDIGTTPMVLANEAGLGQVFINLLVNAGQALPEGEADAHRITVRSYTHDNQAVVEVCDTGPGIPPEVRKRIFDPFFTTKPVGHGTGLGLSICRETVLALGGTIDVDSRVGHGSTFRVRIPADTALSIVPAAGSVPPVRVSSKPSGPRARVLVVDDEEDIGRFLMRSLAGYDVTVVRSGRRAREILSDGESFDVVLCDLMMPDVSGMELFRGLRDERPDLADCFIFMTGGAFSPEAEAFVKEVGEPDLRKPFSTKDVQRVIAQYLEGGSA